MTRSSLWAHRGTTGPEAPDNSLAALEAAVAAGADGVELDVRLSPDGQIRVSHDPLGPDLQGVATLADALDACGGLVVNVELKDLPHEPGYATIEDLVAEVAALLERRGGPEVVVSSFHLPTLTAARAALPARVRTGWLTLPGAELEAAAALAAGAGHDAVHPHLSSVDAAGVAEAHRCGLAVHAWTVNDPDDATRLAAFGVDALITDDIRTLRTVLIP